MAAMVKAHGCNSLSDYIAGLVLLDHLTTKGTVDASELDVFPAWLLRGHLVTVEKGKVKAERKERG